MRTCTCPWSTSEGRPVFDGGPGPHGLTPAGEVGDRRRPGLAARAARRVRRVRAVAAAAGARQLGRRRGVLGPGEPRGGGPAGRRRPGSAHGANIELKVVDPSANPYLAVAGLLGSARLGVQLGAAAARRGLGAPRPVGRRARRSCPPHQAEAIDALEASAVARDLLGAPIVAGVVAVRRHEVGAVRRAAGRRDRRGAAPGLELLRCRSTSTCARCASSTTTCTGTSPSRATGRRSRPR